MITRSMKRNEHNPSYKLLFYGISQDNINIVKHCIDVSHMNINIYCKINKELFNPVQYAIFLKKFDIAKYLLSSAHANPHDVLESCLTYGYLDFYFIVLHTYCHYHTAKRYSQWKGKCKGNVIEI